ncbi:MAG: type II secretion system GspH family protein [Candidatus Omnitrophica bacterium]|nr:type II secretion system GspH family protein [Candidatus Omnitrophota bacterium]
MIYCSAVKQKKGFTLVEIVVVLLILGGVIAGFLSVNTASFSLLEQISSSVIAVNDARSVIENMRNIDPFNAANLTSLYPDGANVVGFDNLVQESVKVNYLNTGSDPIQVTVSVSWQGRANQAFTEQLTTLLTAR